MPAMTKEKRGSGAWSLLPPLEPGRRRCTVCHYVMDPALGDVKTHPNCWWLG